MLLSLIFSLLTHPLDNGPYSAIDFTDIEKNICNNNIYISPIDGTIGSIDFINNKYTIKITNENVDIMLVGLDETYVKIGDNIIKGKELGKDNSITFYTEFIMIQYNKTDMFPQFSNNKLYFKTTTQGLPVYSMDDGIVSFMNYENDTKGLYIQIRNIEKSMVIEYWHNLRLNVRWEEIIKKNQQICYSGNTGLGQGPHLAVSVNNNFYDYKAIYIKNKIIDDIK
ncbi:hypothetical protein FACS189462_0680 [Spirochaetia bacterium]|nr:hypothetical protein FACS189462_0680 [Spirochaetia bacterium]